MNQCAIAKNKSEDLVEMIYIYLAELEALVDRLSDNGNDWLERASFNVLLTLTQHLGLEQLKATLADVSDIELRHGVDSDRKKRIRSAFNAEKLQLYCALDTDWTDRPKKMKDAA